MPKKFFPLPGFALAMLLLLAPPAPGGQKSVALQDFNGTWLFDVEKSRAFTKEAVSALNELKGFSFTIDAKAGLMRLEWPEGGPQKRRIASSKSEGASISLFLDGQKVEILLEKVSEDELLVKDRDEALVFVRVKP